MPVVGKHRGPLKGGAGSTPAGGERLGSNGNGTDFDRLSLAGLAAFLLALDLVLPSGGILLVLAIFSSAGSILFAFRHSYEAGIWLLIAELACVPLFAWLFVKIWPKTPIGRLVIIEPQKSDRYHWETESMVGKEGLTVCDFVPAGQVEIEGRRCEATSRAGLIPQGALVKVVGEEMGHLFVVPVQKTVSPLAQESPRSSSLDQPANDLGIDSL